MNIVITTDDLRDDAGKDLAFIWAELISQNVLGYDLVRAKEVDNFFGSIRATDMGKLFLGHVQCSAEHAIRRSRAQIAKSQEEHWMLCLQVVGNGVLLSEHKTTVLQPGDWTLYDCSQSYSWNFSYDHAQLVLKLPREELQWRLGRPDKVHGLHLHSESGLGKITWDFIRSIWDEHKPGREATLNVSFTEMISNLVSASCNHLLGQESALSRNDTIRLMEIKEFINSRLSDHTLNVDSIAKALHISTRYLHLLFSQEELTVSRYIRELRLSKCAQDLRTPALHKRSITEIAFAWGFSNLAHFCRLFKQRYGFSARDYREQQISALY